MSHKWRHNFNDASSEICCCNQGIEDTSHFLFSCPFFATQRATLAASVINILRKSNLNFLGNQSELYLYGHRSLKEDNQQNVPSFSICETESPSRI